MCAPTPSHPQSNGKLQRRHQTVKDESIRLPRPLVLEDARQIITEFVEHYDTGRLHSVLGCVTPSDKLAGGRTRSSPLGTAGSTPLASSAKPSARRRGRFCAGGGKPTLTRPVAHERVGKTRETDAGSAKEQPAEG